MSNGHSVACKCANDRAFLEKGFDLELTLRV